MGDVTFDGGGAIPTTIKSIGDPRELKTAMNLKEDDNFVHARS